MSRKSRGIQAERQLIHSFWENGWAAIRAAGSGSTSFPSPDIIAGYAGRRLVIEAKLTTDRKKYISKKDLQQLQFFAQTFTAEPWIAVKFFREQWYFLYLDDLEDTGKNKVVSLELARLRGLTLQEVLGN